MSTSLQNFVNFSAVVKNGSCLFEQLVVERHYFQAAEMGDVIRRNAVVMEEPPTVLVTYDAMMRSPSDNGLQQFALEAERSVGIVAYSQAKQMAVACRVAEIVAAVPLVHP